MLQQMPSGIVKKDEFSTIEAGKILFMTEAVELQYSKAGKLMIRVSLRASEPLAVANMPHFHYFVIGSDEDAEANNPETWLKNAGRFISFCMALNVPYDNHPIVNVIQNCQNKFIGAQIKNKIRQSKPGQDNSYDGQVEASVSKWLTPGNFTPELDSQVGAGMGASAMPAEPAPFPQQMEAPGQGTFQTPGTIIPANPGLPPGQAPAAVSPTSMAPPGNQPSYVPQPSATPGMEAGQYVPPNIAQPAPAPAYVPPVAPAPTPGQGQVYDPNQGQQPRNPNQGGYQNPPGLPPGVI